MILVFSGGGIKGISLVGALNALDDLGFLSEFDEFAGSSIGSFILALYIVGYSPTELKKICFGLDFSKLKSIRIFDIFTKFGIDSGEKLEQLIFKLLKRKNAENIRMKDLRYKLTVTTVNINTGKIIYINSNNYPDMKLSMAVRMSMSVPWFYAPVLFEGNLYVDGAVIDNYPITIFKDRIMDVLGIYLLEDEGTNLNKIENIEDFTKSIIKCFINGINAIKRHNYEFCTIDIKTEFINVLDYEIDKKQKQSLYDIGYDTIINRF